MCCPGKDWCNGWCRAPASTPQLRVYRVLVCDGAVEGGIFMPGSRDIAEVALAASGLTEAGAAGQGLNRHVVQAFALLTGEAAKRGVQGVGYVADGVLHASSVGKAGKKCKQGAYLDCSHRYRTVDLYLRVGDVDAVYAGVNWLDEWSLGSDCERG